MQRAVLLGTGIGLPSQVLSNADLEEIVDTSDEWIRTRTGISQRRIVGTDDLKSSDLGALAAKEALKQSGLKPSELDLVICATATPDMLFPSTACYIQKKIEAHHAVAYDVSAACSGFLYVLAQAQAFIENGLYRNILLVGTEVLSKHLDWTDRSTCVLFGDGAGACIFQAHDVQEASRNESGLVKVHLSTDAHHTDLLYLPMAKSVVRSMPQDGSQAEEWIAGSVQMMGNEVFKIAVKSMVEEAQAVVESADLRLQDINHVIPHQANIRIINAVMKRLELPLEKAFVNLDRYGNTSAATIPLALHELLASGQVQAGQWVLMVAFGAGFTSGAALLRL